MVIFHWLFFMVIHHVSCFVSLNRGINSINRLKTSPDLSPSPFEQLRCDELKYMSQQLLKHTGSSYAAHSPQTAYFQDRSVSCHCFCCDDLPRHKTLTCRVLIIIYSILETLNKGRA